MSFTLRTHAGRGLDLEPPPLIKTSFDPMDDFERPPSPALPMSYAFDNDFQDQLRKKLEVLVFTQQLRRRLYGSNVAEDFPISHTPPEVKEQYMISRRETDPMDLEAPTPDEDDGWDPSATKMAHAKDLLHTPPSDNSSQHFWRSSTGKSKRIAPIITHTLHTPPSSSEDDSPAFSPKTDATPVHHGLSKHRMSSGRKRSYAQVDDRSDVFGSCHRRRPIAVSRHSTASMG